MQLCLIMCEGRSARSSAVSRSVNWGGGGGGVPLTVDGSILGHLTVDSLFFGMTLQKNCLNKFKKK